ncbi:F-box domain-containing protein [Rhynchospora pubera]|uniref:F-box domain-containing protein n=1 Tax=Rhynchospora pubera TaxID=906938 RepID=A0AAV8EA29_9POAL|nr:F-box domain-containing protein [Rhynchospora pubera]
MNWAELNPDLLCQIAKKVSDISDFIRLRAVCKQWRSAVHPSNLPPQLPYFIQCIRNNNSSYEFQFHPLYSDKTYHLTVQIFTELEQFTDLYGSFTGFVLLFCWKPPITGLLLNPLTGFQALLPIENDDMFPIYFGPSCSPEPSLDENGIDLVCLVANFEPPNGTAVLKWILWRYTDNKWRKITEMHYGHDESVVSYSSGRVYVFSYETRFLRVIDATNGITVSLLPEASSGPFDHIVEACGDLIGVRPFVEQEGLDKPESDYRYELYQLKDSGTNPCWEKVNDIGDRMLFHDNQRYWLCLRASDFEGCKGNCIYSKNCVMNNSVKCYSVTTEGTTQLHHFHDYKKSTWFLPSLC